MQTQTCIVEQQNNQYITAVKQGTVLGYKYFRADESELLLLELRGKYAGTIVVGTSEDGMQIWGKEKLEVMADNWKDVEIPLMPRKGIFALYLQFLGIGELVLKSLAFV